MSILRGAMAKTTLAISDPEDSALIEQTFLIVALEAKRPLAEPMRLNLGGLANLHLGRGETRSTHLVGEVVRNLTLPDHTMSSTHASLFWNGATWGIRDAGSTNGTYVNNRRIDEALLHDGDVIETGSTTFVYRACALPNSVASGPRLDVLPTMSPTFEEELAVLRRIAATDVPVMLTGESGTGKEMAARAIHALSGRSGEYVAVNCGAVAQSLLESELFGHKRGAFSGADRDHDGLLVAANQGTLLLDELVEMPMATQVAFLRVLQEREVRAIGASNTRKVDLRIVTATHANMDDAVDNGTFRADLLARLMGFSLSLPPLRERREDLGLLIGTLLRKLAPERCTDIRFHPAAAHALVTYSWPLNIRELEQALRVALAVAPGNEIALSHLPKSIRNPAAVTAKTSKDDTETQLVALLRTHRGNVSAVAREMTTSRAQIRRLAERYHLDLDAYRDSTGPLER